ncbi:MAG: uroporphyrinogen decarboxylase family protein [Kiritimatiellae bacterium]|nr:uroporphyrinogen decarboxylase family protein [Kiritimatiellia bacterium]
MTSLERYLATIQGRAVDFLPRTPILMQFAAEHIGSNYAAFAADWRVLVEANLRCRDYFGFDQVSAISDPYREAQGFGAEVQYIEDHAPCLVRPPLADIYALSSLRTDPDPYASERMHDRLMAVRAFSQHVGGECSILGWVEGPAAEAADLRGVQDFLLDLMDDEAAAVALMERCIKTAIRFAEAQLAEGADTIGIGDAIASQLPADLYRRTVWPLEKQLVQAIQSRGGLAKLHICGNITHLLPAIAELGVDLLDIDHMVDPAYARQCVGPKTAIAGRIDPVSEVLHGTPESIRTAVQQSYTAIGNPHLVMAGCEIPSGTPAAHLAALCEPIPYMAAERCCASGLR